MGFTLDTGWTHPDIAATTAGVDDTMQITVTDWKRAQNLFNKIKANIEAHEDQDDLDTYMERETLTLDALHLFDPTVTAELQDIYETHRACLVHGGAARRAHPDNTAQNVQHDNSANDKENSNVQSGYW